MLKRASLSLLFLVSTCAPVLAQSCSGLNCLIISQVYGGGGNSGSVLKNDYIELFNRGNAPVSLNGLSVQYAAASSLIFSGITALPNVSVLPGQYYLIQEASGGSGTTALPNPDFTGTINLSATAGQVALINATTAAPTGCPTTGTTIDILGFGSSATVGFCSPAAPAPSVTNSISRTALCTLSSLPSSGFTAGAASPRNTSTPQSPCGGVSPLSLTPASLPAGTLGSNYSQPIAASGGTGPYIFSLIGNLPPGLSLIAAGSTATIGGNPSTATGSPFSFGIKVVDSTSASVTNSYTLVINGAFVCSPTNTIAQIQGSGLTSPLTGSAITTSGIVTAIRSNGFYLQMPSPGDGDPTTSDAVFVFTSSAPGTNAAIGNSVCVSGMVQEFTPDTGYGTITEISGTPTVTQLSTGNTLPTPVALTTADFNPAGGIYQREKYEGMRVSVAAVTVIAPSQGTVDETNATATSNGIFFGVIPGVARPFRDPGVDSYDTLPAGSPATIPVWDDNPEILRVNTAQLIGGVALDVTSGATVSNLVGVFDYKFGQYTLLTDPATPPTASGNVTFTAIPAPLSSDLTVGSFNLQHFYDTTDDPGGDVALTQTAFNNRLAKASLAIRNVIGTPDILALEEVENLSTVQAIAARIDADSPTNPPHYAAYLQPGNDISDINNAFLVKPSTVTVVSVTQYGLNATYIDPTTNSAALLNDRPPLVLKATAKAAGSNQTLALTVIANHLRSLISVNDNTVSGVSTNGARVRAKREAGAEFLANLIQGFQAAGDKVIAVGDFNAYQVNDGYVDVMGVVRGNPAPANQDVVPGASGLVSPILTDAAGLLAAAQQYSDTFDGTAQVLDHFVYSQNVAPILRQVAYGRVNADFPETYRNNATRPERVSDHDPVIGYLTLPPYVAPTDVTSQTTATGSGLTYNRGTQIYSGTITVTNKSALTIAGPIEVLLTNLSAGVTLVNAAGTSSGSPYVTSAGPLAPGASVTVAVQFTATGNARIGYTSKVYSGAF